MVALVQLIENITKWELIFYHVHKHKISLKEKLHTNKVSCEILQDPEKKPMSLFFKKPFLLGRGWVRGLFSGRPKHMAKIYLRNGWLLKNIKILW